LQQARSASAVWWVKARNAVPIRAFREALISGYRRLKIEGGAVFFTLAPADRGSDLLGRLMNAWARGGACHRAALRADPLAPLLTLPLLLARPGRE